jgi:hypothetical protein
MSWQRSPLFLGAWLLSLFLLVLFVLLLMWREKAPGIPMPIVDATPAAETTAKFPASFGSLGDLVPFAGGIAPVATEVTPVEHGPEFRDAAWVAAQNPDSYTLQVLAVHDEGAVKRFLAGREDRAQFVYFMNPQDGADWYVVTTGSFVSRELAMGVADSHDFGLATKPFPKRVGVYQEAIASAAARLSVPVAQPGGSSTPSANAPSAP